MEDKTTQELIHKGFEDMRRWIAEAETPEQLSYRLTAALEVLSGENKVDFHYFRDMSGLNEETK